MTFEDDVVPGRVYRLSAYGQAQSGGMTVFTGNQVQHGHAFNECTARKNDHGEAFVVVKKQHHAYECWALLIHTESGICGWIFPNIAWLEECSYDF